MRQTLALSTAAVLTFALAAYAQTTTPPPDTQPAAQTQGHSPAGEVGSGVGDAGKGAAKGTGAAAAGAGKAAGDVVTLHPIGAVDNAGKGAGKAVGDVGTGAVKGTGKVVGGTGKAVGGVFHHGHKNTAPPSTTETTPAQSNPPSSPQQ